MSSYVWFCSHDNIRFRLWEQNSHVLKKVRHQLEAAKSLAKSTNSTNFKNECGAKNYNVN